MSRKTLDFDDHWRTRFGDLTGAASPGLDDSAWKLVSVPHNWEDYQGYRKLSHGNLHGTAWYRKTFTVHPLDRGRRFFIEFEGVGSYGSVWINGHYLGRHNGGRTCFTFDLTDYIQFGETNVLAVRADHPAKINDLPYVCGGCWGSPNTEGSQPIGIFRPVHLVVTAPVRVEPFGVQVWTPEISAESVVIRVRTEVKNYGATRQAVTVRNEVCDSSGTVLVTMADALNLAPGELGTVDQTCRPLSNPHLWSLNDPYLHTVRTTVLGNSVPLDAVSTRFGLRWIEWPVGSVGQEVAYRSIDPERLKVQPAPQNNFFTVNTGGIEDSRIQIESGGVRVFIPSCSQESATVRVRTTVKNDDSERHEVLLTSFIRNYEGTKFIYSMVTNLVLEAGRQYTVEQTSPRINFPELWSPENPYLHVVETTIEDPANAGTKRAIIYDQAETPFGILVTGGLANKRNAYVEAMTAAPVAENATRQFLLNGKPVFLNGTCEYEHLLGDDHAFTDEQIRARVMQVKAAGFDALRMAHHPHNLRYVELCDELGLLCWTQVGAHIYFNNEAFRDNYREAVREWVRERRNSPSVVLWGLQNESSLPTVFARELTEMIRTLDPTTSSQRKTVTCNGGTGGDWNVPQNWFGTYGGNVTNYAQALIQDRLVGEYGQFRTAFLHAEGDWAENWEDKQDIGRVVPEELFDYCLETRVRLGEQNKDKACGQFQWIFNTHANPGRSESNCRDGLGPLNSVGVVNNKGLLTCWGEPVDAYYLYRANYAPADREPMVYIVSHTWPDRFDHPGIKSNIVVFSNCEEVELFNDYQTDSLGVRRRGPKGTHFEWDGVNAGHNVLYAEGRVKGETVARDLIVLPHLPPASAWQRQERQDADDTAAAPDATYLYRINCGGKDYTDVHDQHWSADAHWSSWAQEYDNLDPRFASVRETFDPITGTLDDQLMQTYRYGRQKLKYNFPVPNGSYTVELYFIEPWYGVGGGMDCTGWRLFDVAVNGQVVLDDFDIWKEAGCNRAVKKVIPVNVRDGEIEISFPEVKSYQAVISAIAVRTM